MGMFAVRSQFMDCLLYLAPRFACFVLLLELESNGMREISFSGEIQHEEQLNLNTYQNIAGVLHCAFATRITSHNSTQHNNYRQATNQ